MQCHGQGAKSTRMALGVVSTLMISGAPILHIPSVPKNLASMMPATIRRQKERLFGGRKNIKQRQAAGAHGGCSTNQTKE